MEMVSAVVLRCEGEGMVGVAGGLVKIDGSIEDAAGKDPLIDRFADCSPLSVM